MTTRITEDSFLEERIGRPITVYLVNGIKLGSMILYGYDVEVVFLRPEAAHEGVMMVTKQAISTILSTPPNRAQTLPADGLDGILSTQAELKQSANRNPRR
jgi:sRNA-binding regulator protein Hfq